MGVAPSSPTCFAKAEGTLIDYFLMHHSLAHSLRRVEVEEGSTIATHKPVHLHLAAVRRPLRAGLRCHPAALPEMPVGCAPRPAVWQPARRLIAVASDSDGLDQAWASTLQLIEKELLNRFGLYGDSRRRFEGRAAGP